MNVAPKVKPFAWTYSKLKNFEVCPRRHAAVDLHKDVEEAETPELKRGNQLHDAMYKRVVGSTPLPPEFIYMEKWAEKLTKLLTPTDIFQGELFLAVNRDGKPVGTKERGKWLSVKIDYLRITPYGNHDIAHIVDYKTGRPREDDTQLLINAYVVFQHYINVTKIRSEFLWTEYSDTSHYDFQRGDMPQAIETLIPRVSKMQEAYVNDNFEPKPCGLCAEYCPVTSCEYYGKRQRRVQA